MTSQNSANFVYYYSSNCLVVPILFDAILILQANQNFIWSITISCFFTFLENSIFGNGFNVLVLVENTRNRSEKEELVLSYSKCILFGRYFIIFWQLVFFSFRFDQFSLFLKNLSFSSFHSSTWTNVAPM